MSVSMPVYFFTFINRHVDDDDDDDDWTICISSRCRPKMAQKSINYHEYNNGINTVLCFNTILYLERTLTLHFLLQIGWHILTCKA